MHPKKGAKSNTYRITFRSMERCASLVGRAGGGRASVEVTRTLPGRSLTHAEINALQDEMRTKITTVLGLELR